MDETDGRRLAQRFALRPVGVLGILLEAKSKGLISEVHPLLVALRQSAGFYISDAVFDAVLRMAGEPETGA